MFEELEYYLGPQGPLAQAWPGYEPRPGQLVMAKEVARAFLEDDLSLIEAGTGTGKTLAYLLPALMSGKKTVVSTGLKNLQDQIFKKDIPFIREYFGDNFRAALLKGRENYVCVRLLRQMAAQPGLFPEEDAYFTEVADWAVKSASGDRAELPGEGGRLWGEISSPSERCLGQRCSCFSDCFLWKARREAAAADLVLVNHHLFMADLSVRVGGFGEVIPEWEAAVFDEAHLLEDAATSYFSRSVNSGSLLALKRDLEAWLGRRGRAAGDAAALIGVFGRQAEALPQNFYRRPGEVELWGDHDPEAGPLRDFLMNFHHDAEALQMRLAAPAKDDDDLQALRARLKEAAGNLLFVAEGADRSYVYQAERQGRRLVLSASPISVSRQLSEHLINSGRTQVFTSATLANAADFSYFKERVGLWPEVDGLKIDSPFDYAGRALVYLPTHLPSPKDEKFPEAVAVEVQKILELSRGRALVLFTSYRNMEYVAERLRPEMKWPLLVQGEKNRAELLDEFRRDIHSVLMATHSFWQGVDVPGESLSAVIIEKLPFPRPDRPLVKARSLALEEDGRDPFMEYYIPEAGLTLKQGLGRLMRSTGDRGLMAVLDVRLTKMGYGKKLLKTLPPAARTSDLADVADFFSRA